MAARAAHDLGLGDGRPFEPLAAHVCSVYPDPAESSTRSLAQLVESVLGAMAADRAATFDGELVAWLGGAHNSFAERWRDVGRKTRSAMDDSRWPVTPINDPVELAQAVDLDPTMLEWFADVRSLERTVTDENLRHYDYRWRPKRGGGARLVEAPKQNLKTVQRRILRRILDAVPAHEAAHGFRRGRSIQSFAAPHTGQDVVVRLDLRSFFTSVPAGRIFAIFTSIGYPAPVAHVLTGLTTNATPARVLAAYPGSRGLDASVAAMLRGVHLPQGAPTSPALANLAAFALDVRLAALAERFDATYTRYADDLAVSGSGDFARAVDRFIAIAATVVSDEGFSIAPDKTRVQRSHRRQVLTGLTVNRHLNVARRDVDRLRALLHDAVHNGPDAANRNGIVQFQSHLEGRIGHVQATNPARARRLWLLFDQIDWSVSR